MKREATRTLLVGVKNKSGIEVFQVPLDSFEVVEYANGEVRMIVPIYMEKKESPAHGIIAVTDDPTSAEPYDYSSLGHAHLRISLYNSRIEYFPKVTVFSSHVGNYEAQLTVGER